ncbi:MAG: aldose 1-epimerase family protein [Ferruginibacter sp.]
MIILQNETLTAVIAQKGAELQQLKHNHNGINYLWSGDAAYWGKYSPVLFPIVGGLKDDTYYCKGHTYKLPRHGFARDRDFTVQQLSSTEALFTLHDDEHSWEVYPFSFNFKIRYQLNQNWLACTYEVYNSGEGTLLFSVGAHPAFAVPLQPGLQYSDYYLELNKQEALHRWKLENGLLSSSATAIAMEGSRIPLQAALFYEDAIVLKGLQSNCITLASERDEHGLNFYFNDFPFFGIWAAKDAPFVCLEPWCGIADSVNHNQQLAEKEGINMLEPGHHFSRTWSVECF